MITFTSLAGIRTEPTSVALGLFDGVHIGHQAVIAKAVQGAGAGLVPSVFTFTMAGGAAPSKKQGSRFILTPDLKAQRLEQLGIRQIFAPGFETFRNMTAEEFVRDMVIGAFRAKEISCGFNFHFGKNAYASSEELRKIAEPLGVRVHLVEGICRGGEPVSSTRIRRCLEEGRLEEANAMLGQPYALKLPVVEGNRLGRLMHFPTINQPFEEGQLIPRFGVYAAMAQVEGREYHAVTNIGVKPTVGSPAPLAETHIIGFEGDLYGCSPTIQLVKFLRPEVKFPNLEALQEQIARDKANCQDVLAAWVESGREV